MSCTPGASILLLPPPPLSTCVGSVLKLHLPLAPTCHVVVFLVLAHRAMPELSDDDLVNSAGPSVPYVVVSVWYIVAFAFFVASPPPPPRHPAVL